MILHHINCISKDAGLHSYRNQFSTRLKLFDLRSLPNVHLYKILLPSFYLLCHSCANIVTPSGGPRDQKAPVIKKRSLKDSAINFKGGKIEFEFNEFIQLKDLPNQLIITPLLKTNPKVTAHRKKITIEMDDSLLQKNTTYSISLGNAIQDLKEGNPFDRLQFTFSTGSYFDSLSLSGLLRDARTGKADTGLLVLLYPAELPDSAFYYQKPMYIQKVDKGLFHFQNLPDKDFKIFALQDQNKNLRYDLTAEKMAFHNRSINPKDSGLINLYSFQVEEQKDTNFQKRLIQKSSNMNKKSGSTLNENGKLNYTFNFDTSKKNTRTFNLRDSIQIQFNSTLKEIDLTKIRLFEDSILDASAEINLDSTSKNIIIVTKWAENTNYKLVLQKGFAQDSSGLKATGSESTFRTKQKSDYGFLTLRCKKDTNDIIELLRNEIVIASKKVEDTLMSFQLLVPDNYQIRILHDANSNGKWDTGSLFRSRIQPELAELYPGQITIKANWENKIDLMSALTKKPLFQK